VESEHFISGVRVAVIGRSCDILSFDFDASPYCDFLIEKLLYLSPETTFKVLELINSSISINFNNLLIKLLIDIKF